MTLIFPGRLAVALAGAAFGLAACGGSGNVLTPREALELRANSAVDLADRLEDTAGTKFSALPTTGTARFEGFGGMILDTDRTGDARDTYIIGDADLTANFRDDTITGAITDMEGIVGDDPATGRIFDVGGRVNIGSIGSQIGDDRSEPGFDRNPNEFVTTARGTISTPGADYRVRGLLDGTFLGTRANDPNNRGPIKGLYAVDENGTAAPTNGSAPVNLQIEVAAESRR